MERVKNEMANPKRRHSKARTAKRRAHDALEPSSLGECPQCHEWGTFVEERLSPGKDPETSNETVKDPEKPTKDSVVT